MQKLEKQFHIRCVEGDVGRYVILPGDPGRCEKIAALFDVTHFVSQNREYTTHRRHAAGREGVRLLHQSAGLPPHRWWRCGQHRRGYLSGWHLRRHRP